MGNWSEAAGLAVSLSSHPKVFNQEIVVHSIKGFPIFIALHLLFPEIRFGEISPTKQVL